MGRAYRKQAMDILDLLKRMQEEISNAVGRKDIQLAERLLAEGQEAAITLGTSIEAHLGEGSDTVKAIEEYCELVYQVHTVLGQERESEAALRNLCDQWQRIRHSAEGELSNQYEMVFLPYKASMWDSLESVWRAADADPDCDAYVIPIPYYDKNPDGTFRSEHYEGGEFPEDVPITHYLEYDLESRHPDVVFIHNPYDDHNFVTSVHPYFYTKNLKQYAEKLVYIPYYVSEEMNPDSEDIIDGKAVMTLTNGVFNSNMVFLQSENTKRLFVNILVKYIDNIDRSYWENKIWGLGSPKLDRVNRVKRDDTRLPESWRDVIYAESGLRKKVVFYNISISTLLSNPDMLNKIRDVLMFFKNSKDVVLWWRPHPLYESTLASMRPDMLAEYQQIVTQYKEEGWGIFDSGVDLQWAIAETDVYYGDKSSVVQLYKEAGKPIMIQDVTVRSQQEVKAEDIPIWPSAFCVDGDDVWFVHGKMNVLMRYDMMKKQVYIIDIIPNEEMFRESLYKGLYKWGNKLFFIPCWAREIVVYDILSAKFNKISLKNIEAYDHKILFHKIYVFDKWLYCIPHYYKSILKMNMDSLSIEYFDISKILEEQGVDMSNVCVNDSTKVGNEIISILAYTNLALCYQMGSDTMCVKRLGKPERKFTNIANIGETLYLFAKDINTIVKIHRGNDFVEEKMCVPSYNGLRMNTIDSKFIMIDSSDDASIQMIDSEDKLVIKSDVLKNTCLDSLDSTYYSGIEGSVCGQSGFSYYYNVSAGLFYQFNGGKLEREFPISLEHREFNQWRDRYLHIINPETKENGIYDLRIWIDGVKEMKALKDVQKQSCGESILHIVKQHL